VLIDSVGLNWQAYNQMLERRYGTRVREDEISKYVGMTLSDQVVLLSQNLGIEIDADAFEQESHTLKRALFAQVQPKEGVVPLLEQLRTAYVPVAVGTSSPRDITVERLIKADIMQYFSVCVAQEDVVAHKPQPDVYIEAAKRLNMPPANCVVIEDAPSGIEAAKRAGMRCVAITAPYVAAEMLEGADFIVGSLAEITIDVLRAS